MSIKAVSLDRTPLAAGREGRRRFTPSVLWALPRLGKPALSPDARRLALPIARADSAADALISRLWALDLSVPADPERAALLPLTPNEWHAQNPAFSPDGKRLAFVARAALDEDAPAQVYVLDLESGPAPQQVTDLPLGALDPMWLPDGSGLVFPAWLLAGHLDLEATRAEQARRLEHPVRVHRTEERLYRFWNRWLVDGRIPHLFHLDLGTGTLKDLTPLSTLHLPFMEPEGACDVSPDGKMIVFQALHVGGPQDRLRSDLWLVRLDEAGSEPRCLTEGNPANSMRPRFDPGDATILYGRTEDPDFYADRPRLWRVDPQSGRNDALLTDWDQAPGSWTFAGPQSVILEAEVEGRSALYRWRAGSGAPERIPFSVSARTPVPGRNVLIFLAESLSSPPEVWCATPSGEEPRALTALAAPHLDDVAIGAVEAFETEGADGRRIAGHLVLPPGAESAKALPLVHLVHGGPHGMFGDEWHWRWNPQIFAAEGYAVALLNFHGSTSYGEDFTKVIQGAWGEKPREDILRATDALIRDGVTSPRAVALAGGSYGGYLVSWLASTTDRFACAVNHAGVYDLVLQYASDVTWGRARAMGADVWVDPVVVDRWNPVRHAGGLSTPMLVLHGEKDYRVPFDQGLLGYGILKARGVPARLVTFEDEGHWILKPSNSLLWYQEVCAWLGRFLKAPQR